MTPKTTTDLHSPASHPVPDGSTVSRGSATSQGPSVQRHELVRDIICPNHIRQDKQKAALKDFKSPKELKAKYFVNIYVALGSIRHKKEFSRLVLTAATETHSNTPTLLVSQKQGPVRNHLAQAKQSIKQMKYVSLTYCSQKLTPLGFRDAPTSLTILGIIGHLSPKSQSDIWVSASPFMLNGQDCLYTVHLSQIPENKLP